MQNKIRKIGVYLALLGYWYNLPILSTGIFGDSNSLRLYDLGFSIIIFQLLIKNDWRIVGSHIKNHYVLRKLYFFARWSSIMVIPTIIYLLYHNNLINIGSTFMYLFHLWGFLLVVAFINVFFDHESYVGLIKVFLILSLVNLLIIYAQASGLIGILWPDIYIKSYGSNILSGTLGPNRVVPGMMTLMGLAFSIYLIVKGSINKLRPYAWINVFLSIPVILMIGSRTTFITFLIFILLLLIVYTKKYAFWLIILIPVFLLFYSNLGPSYKERISNVLEYNKEKISQGSNIEDLNIKEGYENLGNGRYQILSKYVPYLLEHFYFIPFGGGFNNRTIAFENTKAASAHNIYLSLINELGIIGLYLYVAWLISHIKLARSNIANKGNRPSNGVIISLTIAMLISLFAGEHLYVYRSCFALWGTYIFIMNIMITEEIQKKII